MRALPQIADLEVLQIPPAETNAPLSLLVAILSLAVILAPHLVRWWKKRRDARR